MNGWMNGWMDGTWVLSMDSKLTTRNLEAKVGVSTLRFPNLHGHPKERTEIIKTCWCLHETRIV